MYNNGMPNYYRNQLVALLDTAIEQAEIDISVAEHYSPANVWDKQVGDAKKVLHDLEELRIYVEEHI